MHRLYHILLFLLPMISVGQNLVPNGVFNYSDTCNPHSISSTDDIHPWFWTLGSPDFLHGCFPEAYSVPQSYGGGEPAADGEGYCGLICYSTTLTLREFVSVELITPLTENTNYHVSFKVSLMDSIWYATKNIGAALTVNEPQSNIDSLFGLQPQVSYNGAVFLSNKQGWAKVSGFFMAQGGERFLTIGNFDVDHETDTLFIPGGGIPPSHSEVYWSGSYYYVDDVSVIPDSIFQNVNENDFTFSIYPNPATTNITIESRTPLAQVWVRDVTGGQAITKTLKQVQGDRAVIDISGLPCGIYLVEVLTQNGQRSVQKVVVE